MTDEQQRKVDIAIVGATGLVGGAVIELLEQRDFPVGNIYPLASTGGAGAPVEFANRNFVVHELDKFDFTKVQIAFFCVPDSVAKEFIPVATQADCIVIDHSAVYRNDPSVPLVLANANPDEVADYVSKNIIACPDSVSAHLALALNPILAAELPVARVSAHAMCAVSILGRPGIDELSTQSIAMFNLKEIKPEALPKQIAFNILPRLNFDQKSSDTRTVDVSAEIHEIIQPTDILVSVSTSITPVFFGHSYHLLIEFKGNIDTKRIKQIYASEDEIEFRTDIAPADIASVVSDAAQDTRLYIDQIAVSSEKSPILEFWMVADNIRCGVATNSVQIAEILVKDYL